MKKISIILALTAMISAVFLLASCKKDGSSTYTTSVPGTNDSLGDKISEEASDMKEEMSDKIENASENISDIGENLSEAASDAGDMVSEGISDVSEMLSERMDDMRNGMN